MKTEQQIVELIVERSKKIGGQNCLAREIGVSSGHLSHIVNGNKPPGPKVLDYLGYYSKTFYIKEKDR